MDDQNPTATGDPITTGNITNSTGVAIGTGATVTVTQIENNYYLAATASPHAPLLLPSALDPPDPDLPLLSAGRTEELAQLHEWCTAAFADKQGEQPRLVVISGQSGIGKRELLQQWCADLAQRAPAPIVAVTTYLPPYVAWGAQEHYYSDHPGWRAAWAAHAATLRSRYRHTEALGGLAWIALAAQVVAQSRSAQARLSQSLPPIGDPPLRTIQRQMSDLLLAALDDGPLVLILEGVDNAPFAVLQPLLRVWRNELHNLPFLLVLTVDTPAPLHPETPQIQAGEWLVWLRSQTAPHNRYSARYLHVGPLNLQGVRNLLAPASQQFAADLHHTTQGAPALLRELLHHWQQRGEATRQVDGRWQLHAPALSWAPGAIYQRFIEEPLQDCAALAQKLGFDLSWETLLDWLQYAVWEGELFTDEALAHAVGMHGEHLETFQEILDEVLVQQPDDDHSPGLLVELDETIALPTAELARPLRHLALYRFARPLLARLLYHRQHGEERAARAGRYIDALQAAYGPFAGLAAPRLAQICRDIGRAKDAEQFLRLLAPLDELEQAQATLLAMCALAETDPATQQHLVRYIVDFANNAHRRIHPRPLLPLLEEALRFARTLDQQSDIARLLYHTGWCYADLGEPQRALACYEQALPIRRAVGDRRGEAATLHYIGRVYANLGGVQRALACFEQALPIRRAVGDRAGEAATLTGIGTVYAGLGETEKSREYLQQALSILEAIHSPEAGRVRQRLSALAGH